MILHGVRKQYPDRAVELPFIWIEDRLQNWADNLALLLCSFSCSVLLGTWADRVREQDKDWMRNQEWTTSSSLISTKKKKKVSSRLDCINRTAARRLREVILYSAHLRSYLQCCVQFWTLPRHQWTWVSSVKVHQDGQGLEHLPCKERLRELGLFSLEKRWCWRDLTAAVQHLRGGYCEDGDMLFTVNVYWENKRQWQIDTGDFNFIQYKLASGSTLYKENIFTTRVIKQRTWLPMRLWISILEGFQDPTG